MTRIRSTITTALAVVLAAVATAAAGTDTLGKLTKANVKTISQAQAGKQISARAPGLSVAHATTADTAADAAHADAATHATTADAATTAATADSAGKADSATTADTAANAARLGGVGAAGYVTGGGRIEAASGSVPNEATAAQQVIYDAPGPFGRYVLDCNPGANSDVSNVRLLDSGARFAWVQQLTTNSSPTVVSTRGLPPGRSFGPDFDVKSAQAHETWHEVGEGSNALTVEIWIQSTGVADAQCIYSVQATLTN